MIHAIKHFGSSIAAVWISLAACAALDLLGGTTPSWIYFVLGTVTGFGAIILAGIIETIPKAIFKLEWVGTLIYYGVFYWASVAIILAVAAWLPLGISVASPIVGGFIAMVAILSLLHVLYKGSGWKRNAAFPKRRSI